MQAKHVTANAGKAPDFTQFGRKLIEIIGDKQTKQLDTAKHIHGFQRQLLAATVASTG